MLTCEMDETCTAPVTMLDKKGYVYCTKHGLERRDWHPVPEVVEARAPPARERRAAQELRAMKRPKPQPTPPFQTVPKGHWSPAIIIAPIVAPAEVAK